MARYKLETLIIPAILTGLISNVKADPDPALYHHIHNWGGTITGSQTNPTYGRAAKLALGMSYSLVSESALPNTAQFQTLESLKHYNSSFFPVHYNFTARQIRYSRVSNSAGQSLIRTGVVGDKFIPWDSTDFSLLAKFGCSRTNPEPLLSITADKTEFQTTFFTNSTSGGDWAIANLQSKWVVDQLASAYVNAVRAGDFAGVMFDDLSRKPTTECANKSAGSQGSYATLQEGQKMLLSKVAQVLHSEFSPYGSPYLITGNMYAYWGNGRRYGEFYRDGSLRLDMYYLEAGTRNNTSQTANSIDPETGLPAFSKTGRNVLPNYLPANRMVVSTEWDTFPPPEQFLTQHLQIAGGAAAQGSWFGFIVGMTVSQRYADGTFVFDNALQLLRALPNYENLALVPIPSRSYNATSMIYSSPNSYSSPSVVYSNNPVNGELYAVFLDSSGTVQLKEGKTIASATFVDGEFNLTANNALSCLSVEGSTVTLTCSSGLKKGIRITLM